MASGHDPKVHGEGGYSEAGVGPSSDASSWDKRTPMAGESYREDRAGEEPLYVIDETQKQATPPGMLSRRELTSHGGPGAEKEVGQSNTRAFVLAGILGVAIIALGIAGVFSVRTELAEIDEKAAEQAAAKPPPPEDVQGVRVRKGMQHNPMTPAKKPGTTIDDENAMPLNVVPDGAPPPDAPATEPEPAPAPEPTAEPSDIPSGDAPPG